MPADPDEPLQPEVVRGLRWSAIRQAVLTVVGTTAVLAYTRILGPAGLGTYTLAAVLYSGLLLLIQTPFRDAVLFYRSAGHARAAFALSNGLGLLAGGAVFWAAPLIAAFYEAPAAAPLMRGLVIVFWLRSLAVIPASRLLQELRFDLHEGFLVISETVFTLVVLATLWAGWGVTSLVAAQLAAAATFLLLVWWRSDFTPVGPLPAGAAGDVLRFAGRLAGSQTLKYANLNVDQAAVGRLGERPLGLYSFGENRSAFLVAGIGAPLGQIAVAALAAVRQEEERFNRLFLELLRLTHFISTPYHLIILVGADLFVMLFFGAEWLPAVPVLRAYLTFRILQTLLEICDGALSAAGRPELRLRFDLLLFPLFLLGAWLSVTLSGNIVVVAWTLALIRLGMGLLYLGLTLATTDIGTGRLLRFLAPSALAAGVSAAALQWLAAVTWRTAPLAGESFAVLAGWFAAAAVSGTLVYLAAAFALDRRGFIAIMRTARKTLFPRGRLRRPTKNGRPTPQEVTRPPDDRLNRSEPDQ